MTEIISVELKTQALQKIQLLKNSSNPHEYFYDMLQQPTQYESAMIAYQNLPLQLMRSIFRKISLSPQYSEPNNQEVLTKVLLCHRKLYLSQNYQLKEKLQNSLKGIRLEIKTYFFILFFVYLVYFFAIWLSIESGAYQRMVGECDRTHSHIHQEFLLNTSFNDYPRDFALQHLACNKNTYLRWALEYEILMKVIFYSVLYVYILINVVQLIWSCFVFKLIHQEFRRKHQAQSQLNRINRRILQSGQQLRIIQ